MRQLFLPVVMLLFLHIEISAQINSNGLQGSNENAYTTVKPPSIYEDRVVLSKTNTAYFQVTTSSQYPAPNYDATVAVQYAADIWSYLINTNQTVKILVEWKDLGWSSTAGGTLAETAPGSFYNSSSLPNPNFQYPIALAEALLDQNLNGNDYEITIRINNNSGPNWYYGTDGIPQTDKADLVSVVLHELAHGLGFSPSFYVSGNLGEYGYSSYQVDTNSHPTIYDKFPAIGNSYPASDFLLNYSDSSTILKTKLTTNNAYFTGLNSYYANNNGYPKLYVPTSWEPGSSISHLDDDTYPAGSSNSLMTHNADKAEVNHSPGEVGLAVLQDLGWEINRLVTFIYPSAGIALQKGTVDTIRWTDNQNGSFDLILVDSLENFVIKINSGGSILSLAGQNEFVWDIPGSLNNGKYRIKTEFGGVAYGISPEFTISDQQQVATPTFSPPPATYPNAIYVKIETETTGATIRYTTDGSVRCTPMLGQIFI